MLENLSLRDLQVYLKEGKLDPGAFTLICEARMAEPEKLSPSDAQVLNEIGYLNVVDYEAIKAKYLPLAEKMASEAIEKKKLDYEGKTTIQMR